MSDSLGKTLLLPADLKHYLGCQDDDLILKLKWHNIAVRFYLFEPLPFCLAVYFIIIIIVYFLFSFLLFISVSNWDILTLSCSVVVLGRPIDPCGGKSTHGGNGGGGQGKGS